MADELCVIPVNLTVFFSTMDKDANPESEVVAGWSCRGSIVGIDIDMGWLCTTPAEAIHDWAQLASSYFGEFYDCERRG